MASLSEQAADFAKEQRLFETDERGRRVLCGLTVEETGWYLHHIALDSLGDLDRARFDALHACHERSTPTRETKIEPPIVVSEMPRASFSLSTVEQVIDYVRRHGDGRNWNELRGAAFVAAAVPSSENLTSLRDFAARAFKMLR